MLCKRAGRINRQVLQQLCTQLLVSCSDAVDEDGHLQSASCEARASSVTM